MMSAADESMVAQLRDVAARLVADRTDHRRTRAQRHTVPGFSADIWNTCVEMGWLGILVPEVDGGLGLGLPEMAAVVRELEKGLLSGPILEFGVLGARAITLSSASELRSALLAGIGDGSVRPVLALAADGSLPDVAGGGLLRGACGHVAGGAYATHLLVPAREADGLSLYAVPVDTAGVTLTTAWLADGTALGQLRLEGAAGTVLASGTAAEAAIAQAMDETRLVISAGLVGLSEHMLAMTIDYLKVRKQFGQLIGSYQALQHKAVDLHIQKELAVACMERGLVAGAAEREVAALRAKSRTSSAAMRIARESIQLHGAIGFTDEHDLGLYTKRTMVLSAWLGNASVQRRRYIEKGLVFA